LKSVETRQQNDEFAKQNIPADLHSVWERTKLQFKGTPHERAEQFMEYVEEHPEEVAAAQQEQADDKVDAMVREYQSRGAAVWAKRRSESHSDSVPF
jgi:hypothetical protein